MKIYKRIEETIYSKSSATMFQTSNSIGATVHQAYHRIKREIPLSKVHPFEPSFNKVKLPGSKQTYESLVRVIKSGKRSDVPSIAVIPHPEKTGHYLVADGHHRYEAHKTAGARTIRAEVIDPNRVEWKTEE